MAPAQNPCPKYEKCKDNGGVHVPRWLEFRSDFAYWCVPVFGTNSVRVGLNLFGFVAILIASGMKKPISLPLITRQRLTFAAQLSQRLRRQA
jgi:hypothetical protein